MLLSGWLLLRSCGLAKALPSALRTLVQHLVPQGIAGIVVCGSTGEAAALSADEQLAVLDTVAAAAPGLPLVMGLSDYHL
eukprot:gene6563-7862_t